MHPVRVIAGLGNPGSRYDGTRHNIGFRVLDHLAEMQGVKWSEDVRYCAQAATIVLGESKVLLVKPQTYMNESGRSLQEICRFLKIKPSEILTVYDEFQLPLGALKVSLSGSAGGHNGVGDIIKRLGESFIRYRIGIGPAEKPEVCMSDFVLGKFSEDEKNIVEKNLPRLVSGLALIVEKGPQLSMNQLNQRL